MLNRVSMTGYVFRLEADACVQADDILGSYYQNWPVELPILIVHGDKLPRRFRNTRLTAESYDCLLLPEGNVVPRGVRV